MTIQERLEEAIQKYQVRYKINEKPEEVSDCVVLDVEHDEEGNHVGTGILFVPHPCVYYFTDCLALSSLVGPASKIIGHNVVTDVDLLRFWGLNVSEANIYWDTMLMAHIIDSSLKDYGLKGTVKRELNIEYPTYDEIVGKRTEKQKNPRVTLDKQPVELVAAYNSLDVFSTFKLYDKQRGLVNV